MVLTQVMVAKVIVTLVTVTVVMSRGILFSLRWTDHHSFSNHISVFEDNF